ncbi:MAG: alpha-hydroxy-acid oxidizing protein [Pseudomonadota bacterium]
MHWLRESTRMPIVLKGICHPDDARRAADTVINDGELLESLQCPKFAPVSAHSNTLGDALKITGTTPVVGDSADDRGPATPGAVYVFSRPELDITMPSSLLRSSPENPEYVYDVATGNLSYAHWPCEDC